MMPRASLSPSPPADQRTPPSPTDGGRADATGHAGREACRLSRDIASAMLGVPVAEIVRANRSFADTCLARHVAMYLAHVVFQVPLSAIAADFGRDRTSVGYAIRRVEDRRDDAGFDAEVSRLERLAGLLREVMDARVAP